MMSRMNIFYCVNLAPFQLDGGQLAGRLLYIGILSEDEPKSLKGVGCVVDVLTDIFPQSAWIDESQIKNMKA